MAVLPVSQETSPAVSMTATRILATISHPDTGLHWFQRMVLFSREVILQQLQGTKENMTSILKEERQRRGWREELPVLAPLPFYLSFFRRLPFSLEGKRSMYSSKYKGLCSVQGYRDIHNQNGKAELREFCSFNNKLCKYIGRIC